MITGDADSMRKERQMRASEVIECLGKQGAPCDYDWEDYYVYGDLYIDAFAANLDTTLIVPPNYQYRISCKHYAKKNWLMVQTIANTSNIVTTV